MKNKNKNILNNHGSALIMAMFFVVALMTVIPGTMLQMGRNTHETQRYMDQVPLTFVSDSVSERAIRLISDWVIKKGTFPSANASGVIIATDSVLTNSQSFATYLNTWAASFISRWQGQVPILNLINLSNLTLTEIDYRTDLKKRKYRFTADAQQIGTTYKMQLSTEFVVNNARLFDFSTFYNEELEIGAGPNFTLQGPIFSNKNIYLMNDGPSTLSLTLMDGFNDPANTNPEKYVIKSAGNIYFYFNRALGKNYLADPLSPSSAIYVNGMAPSLKDYYLNGSDDVEMMRMIYPLTGAGAQFFQFPKFNFFVNEADWSLNSNENKIEIQDENGNFVNLKHPDFGMNMTYQWGEADPQMRLHYARKGMYETGTNMSLSLGIDPNNIPTIMPGWTKEYPVSGSPLVHPNWPPSSLSQVVADNAPKKDIPIGDPNHPHGEHVLIEPLTDIFSPGHDGSAFAVGETCPSTYNSGNCNDTLEVKEAKLQYKAMTGGLNLYGKRLSSSPLDHTMEISADLKNLVEEGVILGISITPDCDGEKMNVTEKVPDFRLGNQAAQIPLQLETVTIDVGKLVEKLTDGSGAIKGGVLDDQGIVIYAHTYPMRSAGSDGKKARAVKLINAEKLPEKGFTLASNGRVYIQGNFNTFDYNKDAYCSEADWDNKDCEVPPAAIISDSVVVLSNDWANNPSLTGLAQRPVNSDVTVNTAFAVGFLGSQLTERYTNCKNNVNTLTSQTCEVLPKGNNNRAKSDGGAYTINFSMTLVCTAAACDNIPIFVNQCSAEGQPDCIYIRNADGFYVINRNSTAFQQLEQAYLPYGTIPAGDIPIFADPLSVKQYWDSGTNIFNRNLNLLKPVRAFPGVSFRNLHKDRFFARGAGVNGFSCPRICPGGDVLTCSDPQGEETTPSCSWTCPVALIKQDPSCVDIATQPGKYYNRGGDGANPLAFPNNDTLPEIFYDDTPFFFPLYNTHYSGGLENLIGLQESWTGKRLNILGAFAAPWYATELNVNTSPRYWSQKYYNAPERFFDFNEDLRVNSPPAAPLVFSVERKKWEIKTK